MGSELWTETGVADIQTNSGGCSSTVELQPSKLITWVRFPSPAPAVNCAHIAQSVEHLHGKEGVTGSNPVVGSIKLLGLLVGGGARSVC